MSYGLRELFRVKIHQVQMMFDRKFIISEQEKWLLDADWDDDNLLNTFNEYYHSVANYQQTSVKEALSAIYQHSIDDKYVITKYLDTIPGTVTVSSATIKDIIHILLDTNYLQTITHTGHVSLIIISEIQLSPVALKKIKTEFSHYNIEVFFYSMLIINPTKHFLNSKFELMTKDEIKDLKEKYNLKDENLANRQENDIITRHYGAKVGDIFRITRDRDCSSIPDRSSIYYAQVTHSVTTDKKSKKRDIQRGKDSEN